MLCIRLFGESAMSSFNTEIDRDDSVAARVAHNGDVWRRVSEGSARAECDCGWVGPKRSYAGGLAHEDLIRHFDEADVAPTAHDLAREVARRGS
jgi:hypothetical protein